MSYSRVYVPHIEQGPHPAVIDELHRQGATPEYVPMVQADPYSYSDVVREWWRRGDGFVIVEQDSVPPDRALAEYAECDALVCCRPHDCRTPGMFPNFACTKFSSQVIALWPEAADAALAGRNGTSWWEMGLCAQKPSYRGCSRPQTADSMCLDPAAVAGFGAWPGPLWPSTTPYPFMDSALCRWLASHGVEICRHEAPSIHHRDRVHHIRQSDLWREYHPPVSDSPPA